MENNATSINEQQLKGDKDINGKVLVDILNEYVENVKEKEGIQLKKWIHSLDGYPIFEWDIIFHWAYRKSCVNLIGLKKIFS